MLLLVFCDISSNCQRSFMHVLCVPFALFWAISLRWISKAMLTILKMFTTLAMWQCWGCWHLKRYCLEILTTQSNQNPGMGPLRPSMPLRSEILRNCTESSSVASDFWKASTQRWFSYLSSQQWATSDKWHDNDEGASSKIGVFYKFGCR